MKYPITKRLVTTGILTASLALAGNTAMAAAPTAHKAAPVAHVTRAVWPDTQPQGYRAQGYGTQGYRGAPVRYAHGYAPQGYGSYGYGSYGNAPRGGLNYDIAQFVQGMLGGGPVPYAALARDVERMHGGVVRGGGGAVDSPTYDTSTPTAGVDQATLDANAESQSLEQMNDTMALNASMAAAEAQNDAANAATLQTEINAGM
jgi:hypothetical protein